MGTELPGPSGRLALMVTLALIAMALSFRPDIGDTTTQATPAPTVADARSVSQPPAASQVPINLAIADPATSLADAAPAEPATAADGSAPAASSAAPAAEAAASEEPKEVGPAPDLSDDGPGFRDDFTSSNGAWVSMTGSWEVAEGTFVQGDPQGFDYIVQLTADVPDAFNISVRMEAQSAELGGGIILGQPGIGSRRGAYIVDFTAGGSFLRWGRYDPDSGAYTYIGGLNVGADPASPQNLRVASRADTTLVYLNDVYIGAFEAVEGGSVGLVTSQSSVAFDDFVLEEA